MDKKQAKKEAKNVSVNDVYTGNMECEKCDSNRFRLEDIRMDNKNNGAIFKYQCANCLYRFDIRKKFEDI